MPAQIICGKTLAQSVQMELKSQIALRQKKGLRAPGLAVIQLGHDAASSIYVDRKRQNCLTIGIHSFAYDLPANTSQQNLLALIADLNQETAVDGILVQLPLPASFDTQLIIEAIHPHKDVDGFHPYNIGRLAQGYPSLRPCTPFGIMQLLQTLPLSLKGLKATVVGSSRIVGRPMFLELLTAGCTVTSCHKATLDLQAAVSSADLVVAAAGQPGLIPGHWLKEGAIVIDVGMNRLSNGHLVGDVIFEEALHQASYITPVPGGVGPMTVASLMQNTLMALNLHNQDI